MNYPGIKAALALAHWDQVESSVLDPLATA